LQRKEERRRLVFAGSRLPVLPLIKVLSADFLKLVLIATLIGWPIAPYFMTEWMSNFAYHTPRAIWAFIGTGIAVQVIAFL
jgi:putative ABC transport system permease protein